MVFFKSAVYSGHSGASEYPTTIVNRTISCSNDNVVLDLNWFLSFICNTNVGYSITT